MGFLLAAVVSRATYVAWNSLHLTRDRAFAHLPRDARGPGVHTGARTDSPPNDRPEVSAGD
jgi:hypothetical protein